MGLEVSLQVAGRQRRTGIRIVVRVGKRAGAVGTIQDSPRRPRSQCDALGLLRLTSRAAARILLLRGPSTPRRPAADRDLRAPLRSCRAVERPMRSAGKVGVSTQQAAAWARRCAFSASSPEESPRSTSWCPSCVESVNSIRGEDRNGWGAGLARIQIWRARHGQYELLLGACRSG